mmetsp:Transcript_8445/g.23541  ORF Transcript_8445/g.23541 Transcript_8445/m.23541 type:complete len:268 (+) Transcript_8445:38-841(+)
MLNLQEVEVLRELLLQLERILVLREVLQRLLNLLKRPLKLPELETGQRRVVQGLVRKLKQLVRRLEARGGLVHLPRPEVQHPHVVKTLRVVRVNRHRNLKRLLRQVQVPDPNRHLPDVEPHVRHVLVIRELQRPVEAVQRHVVLARVEATQTEVVPQLRVVHPHHQQPPVEPERNLRLVGVEVVRAHARDRLHARRVPLQHVLVQRHPRRHVVQRVVDARLAQEHGRLPRELCLTRAVHAYRGCGLIEPDVHVRQLQRGVDRGLGGE